MLEFSFSMEIKIKKLWMGTKVPARAKAHTNARWALQLKLIGTRAYCCHGLKAIPPSAGAAPAN